VSEALVSVAAESHQAKELDAPESARVVTAPASELLALPLGLHEPMQSASPDAIRSAESDAFEEL
jgi:hypothetical protein